MSLTLASDADTAFIAEELTRFLSQFHPESLNASALTLRLCQNGQQLECYDQSVAEPSEPLFTLPAPARIDQLAARVLQRLERGHAVALHAGWEFCAHGRMLSHPSLGEISLTDKEADLLALLLQHAPQAVSRAQIMQQVWRYDPQADSHTLETHIYRLRQKLQPLTESDIAGEIGIITHEDGYGWRSKAA